MSKHSFLYHRQSKQSYADNILPIIHREDKTKDTEQIDETIRKDDLIDLLHAGSLGCWQWDIKKKEVMLEAGIAKALGYDVEAGQLVLSYEEMADKLHLEEKPFLLKDIQEYLEGKSATYTSEYRMRTLSGTYKWLFNSGVIIERNEQGEALKVAGVIYDITQRKSEEQTNKLLAKLPFSNPDIVIIMNLDLSITYINPSGQKKFSEKLHAMFPPELEATLNIAYKNKRLETIQYMMDDRTYLVKIKPLSGEKQCMVTISDISNVVQIINERNLYFNALQSIKQALFITDKNGMILHVNKEFEQLYGYSEAE